MAGVGHGLVLCLPWSTLYLACTVYNNVSTPTCIICVEYLFGASVQFQGTPCVYVYAYIHVHIHVYILLLAELP